MGHALVMNRIWVDSGRVMYVATCVCRRFTAASPHYMLLVDLWLAHCDKRRNDD